MSPPLPPPSRDVNFITKIHYNIDDLIWLFIVNKSFVLHSLWMFPNCVSQILKKPIK